MKQFAVIGIGNFGYHLATQLYKQGHDVMAIDKNASRVQEIKNEVSEAVVADTTELKTLKELGIQQSDAVVICIGTLLSNSILTTLNVKDLGVERIIVKATNEAHGRVLEKIGASEIIQPEKDMAMAVAERLNNPNVVDYLPFIEGYSIVQIEAPLNFIGKSLKDLNLINKYKIQILAVKQDKKKPLEMIPEGDFIIHENDELVMLGLTENIDKMSERV